MMNPTNKQKKYALSLLEKNGYGSRFMSSKFKELGASMRERSGSVESWLDGLGSAGVSKLIDKLKS